MWDSCNNFDHVENFEYFRKKKSVVHTYSNGFSGFAAYLTEEEAKSISKREGVVSVFPDPILQLHTTRSWEFLSLQDQVKVDSSSSSPSSTSGGADTIVGILDTGKDSDSNSAYFVAFEKKKEKKNHLLFYCFE